MISLLRLVALFVLAGTLLASLAMARPAGLADLGLDLWDLPEQLDRLEHERRRQARLERVAEGVTRRMAAKWMLARELGEGRRTLPEAAALLRDVLSESANGWEVLRQAERGGSDEERLCRHLIIWVKYALAADPEKAERTVRHLEAELKELLRRDTSWLPLPAGEGTTKGPSWS